MSRMHFLGIWTKPPNTLSVMTHLRTRKIMREERPLLDLSFDGEGQHEAGMHVIFKMTRI
jgi:hypothetical protein